MSFDSSQCNHPILREWLHGSTCAIYRVNRSVLFENEDYIVLKHNAHSTYGDRMSGSGNCEAFAALYRKEDLKPDSRNIMLGDGELKKWTGRINKRAVWLYCCSIGIVLNPHERPKS